MLKIENSNTFTKDDKDNTDENDIRYGSVLQAYIIINEKINFHEQKMIEMQKEKNNLFKLHFIKEITDTPLITKYKFYECEFNYSDFRCRGSRNGNGRWKYKNLG